MRGDVLRVRQDRNESGDLRGPRLRRGDRQCGRRARGADARGPRLLRRPGFRRLGCPGEVAEGDEAGRRLRPQRPVPVRHASQRRRPRPAKLPQRRPPGTHHQQGPLVRGRRHALRQLDLRCDGDLPGRHAVPEHPAVPRGQTESGPHRDDPGQLAAPRSDVRRYGGADRLDEGRRPPNPEADREVRRGRHPGQHGQAAGGRREARRVEVEGPPQGNVRSGGLHRRRRDHGGSALRQSESDDLRRRLRRRLHGKRAPGEGSINSPLPGTVSGVRETYMAVMDPHALANAGFFRPIRVIAPEGSVFHAVRPAPTSTYCESMSYSVDLVWKALAPHVPDRLSAGHFLSILATILAGVDDRTREPFAVVEPQPGGWGARNDGDGESGLVACGDGETYIASNEVYERNMPILVDRYELNIEAGTGHGRFRGGFGVIKDYVVRCPEASFTVSVGRAKYPPWGVDGGTDGTPNTCIIFKHGREPMVARKVGGLKLVRGEKVSLRSGGGGGWGPPLERDPELVLSDVRNEYLTVEQARDIYGVVVEGMQVDGGGTQRRREEMRRGHRERRP